MKDTLKQNVRGSSVFHDQISWTLELHILWTHTHVCERSSVWTTSQTLSKNFSTSLFVCVYVCVNTHTLLFKISCNLNSMDVFITLCEPVCKAMIPVAAKDYTTFGSLLNILVTTPMYTQTHTRVVCVCVYMHA